MGQWGGGVGGGGVQNSVAPLPSQWWGSQNCSQPWGMARAEGCGEWGMFLWEAGDPSSSLGEDPLCL